MIYGFARQSEGQARIASVLGEGTTIDMILPRREGTVVPIVEARQDEPVMGRGETVLVVEDETAVRELVTEALSDAGYDVFQACDGNEGLAAGRNARRVDLLITDVGLPGLNGRQLADALLEVRPDLKVIFITGYAEGAASPSGFLAPGMEIITKPFTLEALTARVREMLDTAR